MSLKAVSLSEQIAQHLAEQIITGTLAPGARLPENELAKQLDVSTNSLREAFRVLEKQHLIELQPRKGARVCDVSDEQVHDLYDFLFMLLSRLAGQAASNWMPGQIEDLVEMLPQLEQHYQGNDLSAAHQLAFHFVEIATMFQGCDRELWWQKFSESTLRFTNCRFCCRKACQYVINCSSQGPHRLFADYDS